MADGDTAVLDPETTDAALETEETTAPELETEGSDETSETVEEAPSISLEEHEAQVAAAREQAIAEVREEAARQAERDAAQQRRTQAVNIRNGQAYQQFSDFAEWAHKEGEVGHDLRLNPQVLNPLVRQFEKGIFQEQSDAWDLHFQEFLKSNYKDFKLSPPVTQRIKDAAAAWQPDRLVAAQFDAMREAVREEVTAKVREEVEAELKGEEQTKAAKDTASKRGAQPKETSVAAQAARVGGADLSGLIADVNRPLKDRRAAFKQLHGFDPAF